MIDIPMELVDFINKNKEGVMLKDWKTFFETWYRVIPFPEPNSENLVFNILCDMLKESDIDPHFNITTRDIRENIIKLGIKQYIQVQKRMGEKMATRVGALNNINCRLGIGLIRLADLFKDVCVELNLEPTTNIYVQVYL